MVYPNFNAIVCINILIGLLKVYMDHLLVMVNTITLDPAWDAGRFGYSGRVDCVELEL